MLNHARHKKSEGTEAFVKSAFVLCSVPAVVAVNISAVSGVCQVCICWYHEIKLNTFKKCFKTLIMFLRLCDTLSKSEMNL